MYDRFGRPDQAQTLIRGSHSELAFALGQFTQIPQLTEVNAELEHGAGQSLDHGARRNVERSGYLFGGQSLGN